MDWERCLFILEGHGVGPSMHCLICHFWDEATNICRTSGNYGTPFKTGRGVTQGSPLSAKLFDVMVDTVVREWLQILRDESGLEGGKLDKMMDALFAIFYVDDAYTAAQDPVFLQRAKDGLVSTFECVGLETNISKTKTIICTHGKIRLQLPADSYRRMRTGRMSAAKWDTPIITCRECGKDMRAGSLSRHLADLHEIYQGQVVAEELLNQHEGVVYTAKKGHGKLKCPFPLCTGELASGWMMQWHFCVLYPLDYVTIPREGQYPWCPRCGMQVDPRYPAHINRKECRAGMERRHQRDMAVQSALALCKQFTVHGVVLEKVKVYRYLGCLLSQDNDDVQTMRIQLQKA